MCGALSHKDIFTGRECMKCHLTNPRCLTLAFKGTIVRLNNSSYSLVEPCVRSHDIASCTGIFCRNCIDSLSHANPDSVCCKCNHLYTKASYQKDDQCHNCRAKYLSYDKLPTVTAPKIKNLLRESFGIAIPPKKEKIFKFNLCDVFKGFSCDRCSYDDPVTLWFCVNPTGRVTPKDVTFDIVERCILKTQLNDGIFCDVCVRQLYHFDGSSNDNNYYFKTRYQRERMKSLHKHFKEQQCVICKRQSSDEIIRCFQFDHIDPTLKRGNICRMIASNANEYRLQLELGKCQLLCTNCHLRRTYDQGYRCLFKTTFNVLEAIEKIKASDFPV